MALNQNFTVKNNLNTLGQILSSGIDISTLFSPYSQYTVVNSNSANWNSVYSTFNTQSANNASVFSVFNTQSANNLSVFSTFNSQSARNASVFSTFNAQSANNISVYSTFNTQSANNASVFSVFNTQSANNASVFSTFNAQSANNLSVFSNVNANSALWTSGGALLTTVSTNSANWNSVYSTFNAQSANNASVFSTFNAQSANNLSVFSTFNAQSANNASVFSTFNTQSANNLSVFSTFNAQSANNASVFSNVNAQSANNESVFSNVNANSASWTSGGALLTTVSTNSANWNSVYSTFNIQSAINSSVYSNINANSASWTSGGALLTTVSTNSANWNSAYNVTTIYQNTSSSFATKNYVNTNFLSVSGGDIYGDLTVNGTLVVKGSAINLNAANLQINDPIIYIAEGNIGNVYDIGLVGAFDDGLYQHTGLVRKASTKEWSLFSGVTSEPLSAINWSEPTFKYDTLNANFKGSLTGNVQGNASTATRFASAVTINSSGDIVFTPTSIDGSVNSITIPTSIGSNKVTYNQIQKSVNANVFLGSDSANSNYKEIPYTTQGYALLSATSVANQRATLGLDTGNSVTFKDVTINNGTVSSNSNIFNNTVVNNNTITITTFPKTSFKTIKYIVQILRSGGSSAACEILVNYNNGNATWEGTVYGLLDNGNIFTNVDLSTLASTIDLVFTLNGNSTYTVNVIGNAI